MIGYQDLIYLKGIANAGTLRKAALELHISQPALTHSLHRIEDVLGAKLFIRSKKGVIPTQIGEIIISQSEQMIADWQYLKQTAVDLVKTVKGRCRIGCHTAVARFSLTKFLPNLLGEHPEIDISMIHDLSRKVTQMVIDSELDLGIVVNPISHPDLIIIELCTDEVGLWVHKSKKVKNDILIYDPNLAQTQWLLRNLEKHKIKFKRHIESSDLFVIQQLANSCTGVAILPQRVVESFNGHNLIPYKNNVPTYKDRICLIYKSTFTKTKLGRTVVESIRINKI